MRDVWLIKARREKKKKEEKESRIQD